MFRPSAGWRLMNKESIYPVSVIIPTYNRSRIVTRAIDSVLSQSYENFEVIVIDDGSTDDTKEVLKNKYGDSIRYIYQPNKGPSAARNTGINASRFELIAFLDSDDEWLREKLELQVPVMSDPRVVLSFANWRRYGSEEDCFNNIELVLDKEVSIIEEPILHVIRRSGKHGILIPNCICKKEFLIRVGCFDERMKIAEDTKLIFRLAFEGLFGVLNKPLLIRHTSNSLNHLTNPSDLTYRLEHSNAVIEILFEMYSRSVDKPLNIQKEIRKMVSSYLTNQSKYYSLKGDYIIGRRKAFESLVYSPNIGTFLKATIGIIFPQIYKIRAN